MESWVEQHHLLDRLNAIFGFDWTWQIVEQEVDSRVKVGKNKKPGQHAYAKGRLTLHCGERSVMRDGVGEATMVGHQDARKAAASLAFRHAMKFATTFLWKGEIPNEEAEAGSAVFADVAPAPQAQAAQNAPQAATEAAPSYAADLPKEWGECMGRICELTGLDRAQFEPHLYKALLVFTGDDGNLVDLTNKWGDFASLCAAKPKWAMRIKKADLEPLIQGLEDGADWTKEMPVGNEIKTFRLTPKAKTAAPIAATTAEAIDPLLTAPSSPLNDDDCPF
jgi:uncharacterized protein CbrC (UPF0167 family)